MITYISILFFSFIPQPKKSNPVVDGLPTKEAMEMVSLCNTFSFSNYYPNYSAFIPLGYRFVGETQETPLHNIVRLFKKDNTLVLVFRGTIHETNSWLENFHFMQVPAKESIVVEKQKYDFKFSEQSGAAVHSGYVMANVYLWNELTPYLAPNSLQNIERIMLIGHSQGGALAQLFLAQMSLMKEFQNIELMNYSFGSPRIGNQIFTDDFNQKFAQNNQSFRFINTADVVCELPVINKSFGIDLPGFQTKVDLESLNQMLQFSKNFLSDEHQNKIDKTLQTGIELAAEFVKENVGEVVFPKFAPTIFYGETGKIIKLESQPYPEYLELDIKKDNTSFLEKLTGTKKSIQRELTFFQHSIFTYYNAIYEHYDAQHFRRVRLKTLPQHMF